MSHRQCETRDITTLTVQVVNIPYTTSNQGRSPVGVFIKAGAYIDIRLNAGSPVYPIVFELMNNNRNTEFTITVMRHGMNETRLIQNDSALFVRWIKRPGRYSAILNIRGDYLKLPMYSGNLSKFKSEYASSECEYAYLNLGRVAMLVPPTDKVNTLALDLRVLAKYYSQITQHYDTTTGTNTYACVPFFIKADAGGPGDHYYSDSYIANSANTLGPFLLSTITNWPALHQIGHGYDHHFTNNTSLKEVWSSVLADSMQYQWMNTTERQNLPMIYDGDRREHAEAEIVKKLAESVTFHDLDTNWRTILLAFVLKSNFGTATWRNMYSEENQIYDTFLRMVMQCSADLLAYFSLISLSIPIYVNVEEHIYARAYPFSAALAYHKPSVYPVRFLIDDYDTVSNNYDLKMFLDSNLSLVSVNDLVQAKIVQEKVTVKCVIDDPTQIIDEVYSLYDGSKLIQQGIITESLTIEFSQLYHGVYTLRPPRGLDKRYKIKLDTMYTHLIVDGAEKEHTLVYTPYNHSDLCYHTGHILSPQNGYCATFYIDFVNKKIVVDVHLADPVPTSPNIIFVRILIDTPSNKLDIMGANTPLGRHVLNFVPGAVLRILTDPQHLSLLVIFDNDVLFENSFKLLEDHIEERPDSDFIIENINQAGRWLDVHRNMLFVENEVSDDIYLAVQHFKDDEIYEELVTVFQHYFPQKLRPDYNYLFTFNNSVGRPVIVLTCNTLNNVANLIIYTGRVDFDNDNSDVYVGVEIITDKEILYSRYLTSETEVANLININDLVIKNGSIIKLIHAQPENLYLLKSGQIQDVSFKTDNTLIVVNNQLVLQDEV
jgi:hypothetical protein